MNRTEPQPTDQAVVIIPARYSSTRLHGKPLLEIEGRAMILHVVERARAARHVARVVVATDDARILKVVLEAGYEAVMTRDDHQSGTDRVAEVAATLREFGLVVNLQGDEPLIAPATIDLAIEALLADAGAMISTSSERIEKKADVLSPDVVKVVSDREGRALYFSRAPIPYPRDGVRLHGSLEAALDADPGLLAAFRKHTGLYVFRREFLLQYASWPPSALERREALEQLRALERGIKIKVVEVDQPSIGVDTPEDLKRVRGMIEKDASCQRPDASQDVLTNI